MDDQRMEHTDHIIIEEINFLRAFAVLAVIAIHTSGYFTEIKSYNHLVLVNLWADIFCQFAVPLFILISGFVLAKSITIIFL
ncbi:MAG TPA: hypothetical protein DD730_09365 [Desulfosporosinus sp.]|jgi:surface polysaccharide O-acyltransferase-like enzyme|nr:hypothetical protein [Desulfosporosinus sp.]